MMIENKHEKKNQSRKVSTLSGKRPPSVWILLAVMVGVWLVFGILAPLFTGQERLTVTYSRFKAQARAGNVSAVLFKGEEIQGTFREGIPAEKQSAEQEGTSDGQGESTTAGDKETYPSFSTQRPPVADDELLPLLEEKGVTVRSEPQAEGWWQYLLLAALPWLLLIGFFVYMRNRMSSQFKQMSSGGGLFGVGKSRARKFDRERIRVSFDDVAGLENAKRDLQEIIAFMTQPKKFSRLGADIPKGVLLMGAPGTGKTLLARATAGEAGVPFFSISGSEFIEMFVGVGASRVRDMFATAKKEAPAVIFVDEIDSVGRVRGTGLGGGHDEREQTLNQILSEMDGFEPQQSVVVLAATNRPDVLDPALTRPGRFDRQIQLEMPHKKAREQILRIHVRDVPLAGDVDLAGLAARTVGFSGADLKNMVNEAALLAGRKRKEQVSAEEFGEARDKIILGNVREDFLNDDEKKIIAYHESGHALLAGLLPGADPIHKVTIVPRGRSLGATEQAPEREKHNLSRAYLKNRLTIMLAGRAAEEQIFDDLSTGAANDLKEATRLARRMVCQWGMSDQLGPVTYRQGEAHPFLGREMAQPRDFSEATARIIDEEVRKVLTEAENNAAAVVEEYRSTLDRLAEQLLENEVLEADEVRCILEKPMDKTQ
jgi:cell division protease FtsH